MPLISDFEVIGSHVSTCVQSVHSVTVPSGANGLLMQCIYNTIIFTYDGSTPTADSGFRFQENVLGPDFFPVEPGTVLKFIEAGAGARLNYQFVHYTNGILL